MTFENKESIYVQRVSLRRQHVHIQELHSTCMKAVFATRLTLSKDRSRVKLKVKKKTLSHLKPVNLYLVSGIYSQNMNEYNISR